jgi:hypothetical protein
MSTPLPKLSQPALRALNSIGLSLVEHLSAFTEKDIKALHGFGPSGLKERKAAMAEKGISFKSAK